MSVLSLLLSIKRIGMYIFRSLSRNIFAFQRYMEIAVLSRRVRPDGYLVLLNQYKEMYCLCDKYFNFDIAKINIIHDITAIPKYLAHSTTKQNSSSIDSRKVKIFMYLCHYDIQIKRYQQRYKRMKRMSICKIMTAAILLTGGCGTAAAQDVATVNARTAATQVVEKKNKVKQAKVVQAKVVEKQNKVKQNKVKQAKVVTLQIAHDGQTVELNPDKMPEFHGGNKGLAEWLSKNTKYPKEAKDNNEQGRVVVSFVVDKDGKATDAKVVRSISPTIDKEAMRLIEVMPRWTPGEKDGQPVAVRFTLPMTFKL